MRRRCVTLFQIRIRKSYTIPCHRNNINWFFSPPCGSHFGGIWERCIWTVQKILQALRANYGWWKSGHLNVWSWEYHEQPTHNYHVWWSKQQLTPWRPTTCCCSNRKSPYPPVYSRGKILLHRRCKEVQYFGDIFWKRWSKEYLPLMQLRQKSVHPKRNLAVGDIVLAASELHRNYWPPGESAHQDSCLRKACQQALPFGWKRMSKHRKRGHWEVRDI